MKTSHIIPFVVATAILIASAIFTCLNLYQASQNVGAAKDNITQVSKIINGREYKAAVRWRSETGHVSINFGEWHDPTPDQKRELLLILGDAKARASWMEKTLTAIRERYQ